MLRRVSSKLPETVQSRIGIDCEQPPVGKPLYPSSSSRGSGWSAEGTAAVLEAAMCRDWELDRLLRFRDGTIEARYCSELAEKKQQLIWRTILFWCFFSIGEFLIIGGPTLLFHNQFAARVISWGRIVMISVLLSGAVLVRSNLHFNENVTIGFFVFLPPAFIVNNGYRMAKMFSSDFLVDMFGHKCHDDTQLVLVLLIMCCMPIVFCTRVYKAWPVLPWSSLVYSAFSLTGLGPSSLTDTIVISIGYSFLVLFLLYAAFNIEKERRVRWADNLRLRAEAAAQEAELRKQRQWLLELEERLQAFEQQDEEVHNDHVEEVVGTRTSVPPPNVRFQYTPVSTRTLGSSPPLEAPNTLLARAMSGRDADRERLRKMATRIRDSDYGAREFFEDCLATFPELELFYVAELSGTSSGHTAEAEYQRTVGALFAVYWLLRLDEDGKEGFCYGLSKDWSTVGESESCEHGHRRKREKFLDCMDWQSIEQMVGTALEGSIERLEAMLSLTAFHDIMKVQALCPTVAPEHAPYVGYAAGSVINDHDVALAYVLEHYPGLLPSFRVLPTSTRSVILFTQGRMNFNHGWFVQAEAPPGPMLTKFRSVLHKAQPADLAFYFFHWLTDLSGAEGKPMAGAEKFVLKFPQPVLSAFLWSIPFLQALTKDTETQVMERYLEARFKTALENEPPQGPETVALQRLVVMSQGASRYVQEAWFSLPPAPRQVLAVELARTGLQGQRFSASPQAGGPALFVYYGPALVQRCSTSEEMVNALAMLASLYRAGRELWPLAQDQGGAAVMLEAGALKANGAEVVKGAYFAEGKLMVLERRSDIDGVVTLVGGAEINEMVRTHAQFTALEPWQGCCTTGLSVSSPPPEDATPDLGLEVRSSIDVIRAKV